MPNVTVGQVWKLVSPHTRTAFKFSTFTVTAVDDKYATVVNGMTQRRILLERFSQRCYYKLMREPRA